MAVCLRSSADPWRNRLKSMTGMVVEYIRKSLQICNRQYVRAYGNVITFGSFLVGSSGVDVLSRLTTAGCTRSEWSQKARSRSHGSRCANCAPRTANLGKLERSLYKGVSKAHISSFQFEITSKELSSTSSPFFKVNTSVELNQPFNLPQTST